jgi:glycosyltransferase involved in cell wall biosynthesis
MSQYTWGAVVACKNEEERVATVIDVLLSQTIKPKIIAIVDDGSKDKTYEIAGGYDDVVVTRLPDRGYNALGMPELAETFNAGFEVVESYDVDFVLVAGVDNAYYNNYVEVLIEEFKRTNFKLGMTSGNPEGEPIAKGHVSGGGRLINSEFFKKVGYRYPEIHGWESVVIFESLRLEYLTYSIPEIFPINRASGTHHRSYIQWGKGMRAVGYWFPFTYRRVFGWMLKRRFRGAWQLLRGYYSRDVVHANKVTKKFVKKYQQKRVWNKIKSKFKR